MQMSYTAAMQKRTILSLALAGGLLLAVPSAYLVSDMVASTMAANAEAERTAALASLHEQLELVKQGKRSVNAPTADGSSLLMLAVRLQERDAVSTLLLLGADPEAKSAEGISAHDLAADDSMRSLLREQAPIMTREQAETELRKFIVQNDKGADCIKQTDGTLSPLKFPFKQLWDKMLEERDSNMRVMHALYSSPGSQRLASYLIRLVIPPSEAKVYEHRVLFQVLFEAKEKASLSEQEVLLHTMILRAYGAGTADFLYDAASSDDTERIRIMHHTGADLFGLCTEEMDLADFLHEPLLETLSLPLGGAVYFHSLNVTEQLLQLEEERCKPHLDKLLALALLSGRNKDGSLEKLEQLLKSHGARHGALSLACAALGGNQHEDRLECLLTEVTERDTALMSHALRQIFATYILRHVTSRRLELMIQAGADVHALEGGEGTNIFFSYGNTGHLKDDAFIHQAELFRYLVSQGMDAEKAVNGRHTNKGWGSAPLLQCAAQYCPRAVAFFLEYGADPHAINPKDNKKPIDHSKVASIRWMLSVAMGQPLERIPDKDKALALVAAAIADAPTVAATLVQHGAAPTLKVKDGKAAIDFARSDAMKQALETAPQ